jgi:hypothetical protein
MDLRRGWWAAATLALTACGSSGLGANVPDAGGDAADTGSGGGEDAQDSDDEPTAEDGPEDAGANDAGDAGGVDSKDGGGVTDGRLTERDASFPSPVEIDFIPVADRVDVVHDAKRHRLYVSTKSGGVVAYDLESHSIAGRFELGGSLVGIDLSPSEDLLLVADAESSPGQNWIHAGDLAAGTWKKITFASSSLEAGTFVPLLVDDATALVSSSFTGPGWVPLRRVRLDDGSASELRQVTHNTMLAASADRTVVGIAEANASNGPVGRFRPGSGEFAIIDTNRLVYEIGVSRAASHYAVPTADGLLVYDANFKSAGTLGSAGQKWPVGVVYSPTSDEIFVAWTYPTPGAGAIEAYDSDSLDLLYVVETNRPFEANGNVAFVSGRLRTSRNGSLLFATVAGGVAVYAVGP